jgi:hypothetical protein
VAEQGIARVLQESIWRIDAESLARRSARKTIQIAHIQSQSPPHFVSVDVFNWSVLDRDRRVVQFEGTDCVTIKIIGVQAMEPRLPQAFGDAASASEKVDRRELMSVIHGGYAEDTQLLTKNSLS